MRRCVLLLAAGAALMSVSAFAQEVAPTAPPAPTPAAPVEAPAPATAAPADPLALVQAALDKAQATKCRFAYSMAIEAMAQAGLGEAEVKGAVRFDPRLPIGERWTIVEMSNRAKQIQRSLAKQDAEALPNDLHDLLPSGPLKITNLALKETTGDIVMFSFTPVPDESIVKVELQRKIQSQLVGELEARKDGTVLRRVLRVPDGGIRAGIAKLQAGSLSRSFQTLPDGQLVAESEVNTLRASALLSTAEQTTTTRFLTVEPICDAAIVAEIGAKEAAAQAAKKK
jgi:hypothetical protein